MKKPALIVATLLSLTLLAGCNSKADTVSKNISTAADNFQVERDIVFYNGITDKYIAEVVGKCSLGNADPSNEVSVTCKTGPHTYTKDYFHYSDNVTTFVLQVGGVSVSDYHTRIIFRPSTVIPNIDVQ